MTMRVVAALAMVFAPGLVTAHAMQGSPGNGDWAQGYNHPTQNGPASWPSTLSTFEAINMAVIPLTGTGTPSDPFGKVIVWDKQDGGSHFGPGPWDQRFSVGAPNRVRRSSTTTRS